MSIYKCDETREQWFLLFIAGLLLALALFATTLFPEAMWPNLASEGAGLSFTILVINALVAWQNEEREKRDPILQMGSPDNTFAKEAVRKLRVRGWLEDGSLRGTNLSRANLEGANLSGATVTQAKLHQAKSLEGATMPDGTKHSGDTPKAEQEPGIAEEGAQDVGGLREARLRAGLTQAELAEKVGVSPSTLGRWEREGRPPGSDGVRAKVAEVLDGDPFG